MVLFIPPNPLHVLTFTRNKHKKLKGTYITKKRKMKNKKNRKNKFLRRSKKFLYLFTYPSKKNKLHLLNLVSSISFRFVMYSQYCISPCCAKFCLIKHYSLLIDRREYCLRPVLSTSLKLKII